MPLEKTNRNGQARAETFVSQMQTYTRPMIAVLYGAIDENSGETVGTGTFIKINNRIYILTALHVINKARNNAPYKQPAYSCLLKDPESEVGQPVYQIHGMIEAVENYDIALVEIDPATVENALIPEFSTLLVPSWPKGFEGKFLEEPVFVQGCPEKCSKFSVFAGPHGGITGKTNSLGSWTAESIYKDFEPNEDIAIDYQMEGNIALTGAKVGQPVEIPLAFGFSGSSLWRVNYSEQDWSPAKAKVIGVLSRWHPDGHQLWAVRSEIIFQFLASLG